MADGNYIAIDQNQQVAAIKTPVDVKLIALGAELNKTYVFFGAAKLRKAREALQIKQDKLAEKQAPAAAASRAVTKGGGLYNNARFDLVDALEKRSIKLEDLKDDQLCEALKGKSLEEKKAYVEAKAKKRKQHAERETRQRAAQDARTSGWFSEVLQQLKALFRGRW